MKKTFYLFGAVALTATTVMSCSTDEAPAKPKNYYGVDDGTSGTPKEAYYALFGAIVLVVILIAVGIKKMGQKKY